MFGLWSCSDFLPVVEALLPRKAWAVNVGDLSPAMASLRRVCAISVLELKKVTDMVKTVAMKTSKARTEGYISWCTSSFLRQRSGL